MGAWADRPGRERVTIWAMAASGAGLQSDLRVLAVSRSSSTLYDPWSSPLPSRLRLSLNRHPPARRRRLPHSLFLTALALARGAELVDQLVGFVGHAALYRIVLSRHKAAGQWGTYECIDIRAAPAL